MNPSHRPTVLVVDNDELLTRALATRLGTHGYFCLTAGSGAQALSIFQTCNVELVISDLSMPAGDGVSLAMEIRKTSAIPIILVTGHRDAFRRVMRQVPDVTILEKPFSTRDLLSLVEASLASRQI